MPELTVRINPVAQLRSIQKSSQPDPTLAAVLAELAGADRIAVYIPRNRKIIQDRDIQILRHIIQTELILELSPSTEMIGFALEMKPERVTLVADKTKTGTAQTGIDLMVAKDTMADLISTLRDNHIDTAVCIDPDPNQVRLAHKIHATMIQLHAGEYSRAKTSLKKNRSYSRIMDAVNLARKLKLRISIGNGLDYPSIKTFSNLNLIDEVCVGHSLISRAVMVGIDKAVSEMTELVKKR